MRRGSLALLLAVLSSTSLVARAEEPPPPQSGVGEWERRLKAHDESALREQERALRDVEERIRTEKDPLRLYQSHLQLFGTLMVQRRYRRVAAEGRALATARLPPPPLGAPPLVEVGKMYVVVAEQMYRDWDAVLRDGDRFLTEHPGSMYYPSVRTYMSSAITEKRLEEQGARNVVVALRELDPVHQKDPCRLAILYTSHHQWRDARKVLESLKPGRCPPSSDEVQWFWLSYHTGDFPRARAALERLRLRAPELYQGMSAMETMFPVE